MIAPTDVLDEEITAAGVRNPFVRAEFAGYTDGTPHNVIDRSRALQLLTMLDVPVIDHAPETVAALEAAGLPSALLPYMGRSLAERIVFQRSNLHAARAKVARLDGLRRRYQGELAVAEQKRAKLPGDADPAARGQLRRELEDVSDSLSGVEAGLDAAKKKAAGLESVLNTSVGAALNIWSGALEIGAQIVNRCDYLRSQIVTFGT